MLRKITGKRGQHVIDKLLIWLLALLVLAVVLVFLFYNDIIDWMRDLPGYEGDVEDVEISEADVTTFSEACPSGPLGVIKKDERNGENELFIIVYELKENRIADFGRWTNLYWDETGSNKADIMLALNWARDVKVGEVIGNKLTIQSDYRRLSSDYIKYSGDLPTLEQIYRIHNSFKLDSPNLLCKSQEDFEKEQEIVEEIKTEIVLSGESRQGVSIIFNDGFLKRDDDEIVIWWNFFDNTPMVLIKSNQEQVLINGKQKWITSADDEIFENPKIKDKIEQEDIILIKRILSAETAEEFSRKIQEVIETGRASFFGNKEYNVKLFEINNLLYGLNDVPTEFFENLKCVKLEGYNEAKDKIFRKRVNDNSVYFKFDIENCEWKYTSDLNEDYENWLVLNEEKAKEFGVNGIEKYDLVTGTRILSKNYNAVELDEENLVAEEKALQINEKYEIEFNNAFSIAYGNPDLSLEELFLEIKSRGYEEK